MLVCSQIITTFFFPILYLSTLPSTLTWVLRIHNSYSPSGQMLPVPFALLLTAIATASPHLSNISTPTGSTARYITHAVAITDTRLARRNNGIIRQGKIKNPNTDEWIDAPFELKALVMTNDPSTGRINPDLNEFDYVYRSEAGSGTWVYLVESGIDEDHPVSLLLYPQDVKLPTSFKVSF